MNWGGWMAILDKCNDVAIGFVHSQAAGLKTWLGNNNLRPPGLASILTAPRADVAGAPRGDDCAFHRHYDVPETFAGKHRLEIEFRFAEMGFQRTLNP